MENSNQKRIDITSISGYAIDVDSDARTIVLYGTKTLGADFLVTADGSPTEGHGIMVYCNATITPGGYSTKVFGTTINPLTVAGTVTTPRWGAICLYTNAAWVVIPLAYNLEPAGTTITTDANGNLIVASASIEAAQLGSTLTSTLAAKTTKTYVDAQDAAEAVLRAAGDAAAWSSITGDITVNVSGVSAIGTDKVVAAMIKDGDVANTHIAAAAAIAWTKLATGTASEIMATGAGGVPTTLAVATYPSPTELSYVKGVTSAIQTQLTAITTAMSVVTGVGRFTGAFDCDADYYAINIMDVTGSAFAGTLPRLADVPDGTEIRFEKRFSGGSFAATIATHGGTADDINGLSPGAVGTYTITGATGSGVTLVRRNSSYWDVVKVSVL